MPQNDKSKHPERRPQPRVAKTRNPHLFVLPPQQPFPVSLIDYSKLAELNGDSADEAVISCCENCCQQTTIEIAQAFRKELQPKNSCVSDDALLRIMRFVDTHYNSSKPLPKKYYRIAALAAEALAARCLPPHCPRKIGLQAQATFFWEKWQPGMTAALWHRATAAHASPHPHATVLASPPITSGASGQYQHNPYDLNRFRIFCMAQPSLQPAEETPAFDARH